MSRQEVLRAGVSVVLAICAGCVHQNVIELAPGSTSDSLFFVVRARDASMSPVPFPGVGVAVVRCMDGLPMEPRQLLPDCYEAVAAGAKPLRFFVDVDENIIIPR